MYAFRKPFTAAAYGDSYFGIDFKTILVSSQVLGYTVSKFLGIRVTSALTGHHRALGILVLIGLAELSLLLFATVPKPYSAICLFANGLPLGMVFGLVLGYLEGRRSTEALTAALCVSFILADGFTKTVGAYLLSAGIQEEWMPATAGVIFLTPTLLFVWMLTQVAPATEADVAARGERTPMTSQDRRELFWRYAPGLTMLIVIYLLLTILRSMRADFAPEIWAGLGTTGKPAVFTTSETAVGIGVMLVIGSTVLIRNNRTAFFASFGVCALGFALVLLALAGLRAEMLSGFQYMVITGLGLYFPYVAIHATVFERLMAMNRDRGNIAYLMYLADAFGYLGYVGVMLTKNIVVRSHDSFDLYIQASWLIGVLCLFLIGPCAWYFYRHSSQRA